MSSLIVEVSKIDKIKKHPNADKLQIAVIKGWDCVIKMDQFKAGDKIVFIPPDTLMPRELAEKWGVTNYLAGKPTDPMLRVKTVTLRDYTSYGLIVACEQDWKVGTDVAEFYKMAKYEPPKREGLNGGDAAKFDPLFPRMTEVENVRHFPDLFKEGEMVAVTEKIDGCFRNDQKVMLANGEQIAISEVEQGDMVISYDEIKKEFAPAQVDAVLIKPKSKEWIRLSFDNGQEIVCTTDHRILTKNRGWVKAKDLDENDELMEM